MAVREGIAGACLAALLLPAAAAAQVQRFALVVGNDLGAPPDAPLRYAETDAARVASVLQEVGGVRPENLVLVRGQDAGAMRRALISLNDRVRAAGSSSVLLVYYSGHADATALHLGRTTFELGELEQLVRGSAATFRVLILDACRSGAVTRVKGGTAIPPFELLVQERLAGEGAVVLTSSSASEDSQESDELKGSFFTHALLSGLLGAADDDDDGRVTLDEAYRHAYETTLRASSRSLAGLQHPTFQYDVRGQGNLVLATLEARSPTRAWVEFPPGRTWLLFHSSPDGQVAAEVGASDRVRRLSLRAGRYFVRGRAPDVLLEGPVDAPAGEVVQVQEKALARTAYARLVRKGAATSRAMLSLEVEGRVRTGLQNDSRPCPGLAAGLAVALRHVTLTQRVGWCRTGFDQPGLAATTDQIDLELAVGHAWDFRAFSLDAAVAAGATVFHQRFQTRGDAPARSTAALQLTPSVSVSRDLGARSYLFVSVATPAFLFRTEDTGTGETSFGPSLAPRVGFGTGLRF